MKDFSTKRTLSPRRRQLLEVIERYDFCRIENLEVRGGEPVFDPLPRLAEEIKLGAKSASRPKLKDDSSLPAPMVELLERLHCLGDGRVAVIETRHGLPFKVILEQSASEDAR